VADLLERPDQIVQLGEAAKRHVLDNFVGDLHLLRYAALVERLVAWPGAYEFYQYSSKCTLPRWLR
jgi:hypothetical protein